MLPGSHKGRLDQEDYFCCKSQVLSTVFLATRTRINQKKGVLSLRNLSLPFPLGTHHLSIYIQNRFQLSHAWEDTAILLVLLYNWLDVPNPAMSSTDTPARPEALPQLLPEAMRQNKAGCSVQDGLLRCQELNLLQGWLDYRTAEWVYKSPSAAQQSWGQSKHPSMPKEMDEIRRRAKEAGRFTHLTLTKWRRK